MDLEDYGSHVNVCSKSVFHGTLPWPTFETFGKAGHLILNALFGGGGLGHDLLCPGILISVSRFIDSHLENDFCKFTSHLNYVKCSLYISKFENASGLSTGSF